MTAMTRTSYLRVYQPLDSFGIAPADRDGWLEGSEDHEANEKRAALRWLVRRVLPDETRHDGSPEGAFVRRVGAELFICPRRTRLRMLAGMLAFRGSLPEEVAEAFVPRGEARRAAQELERLESDHPEERSHILHANWHVPLRWFACFDDTDRILTEDKDGLRIRYESDLDDAKSRLEKALNVLETMWIDDGVVEAVRELSAWLGDFTEEGILELDYGTVAGTFSDEDLLEDHSAAAVWSCLEAMEGGDLARAGGVFSDLTDRWTVVRATEVVN